MGPRSLARVLPRGLRRSLRSQLANVLDAVGAEQMERRVMNRSDWAIAIHAGAHPTALRPEASVTNPVLTYRDVTDVRADFVADPFMVHRHGVWHMFFEVYNRVTDRGEIGHATSVDGSAWTYQQIVLSEPFHLSYPYVFDHGGDVFMIPETSGTHAVRLYRAASFPGHWVFEQNLIEHRRLSDASTIHLDGHWWLFAGEGPIGRTDTLRLYHAPDLGGPWVEHPRSPIIEGDARTARPAGRIVHVDGRVLRFAQDCEVIYGRQVWAFAIDELTATSYREHPLGREPVLSPGTQPWNAMGMHHLDPHRLDGGRWVACVDGRSH